MTHAAKNKFDCPMCRTEMVDKDEDEDLPYEDAVEDEDEDEDEDYALRGFRFLFQRLTGEELLLENDNEDEEEDAEVVEEEERKPSIELIVHKLREVGVTMEDLVKSQLIDHPEYDESDEIDRVSGEIFGKIRIIISNYEPNQEEEITAPPEPEPEPEIRDAFIEKRFMMIY
jgi:C4-type Zn-finger protein